MFHASRIWSGKNAFGNWLGWVCPSCRAEIPCLWNLTSRVLLLLTAPIWWLPIKSNKDKLIARQFRRLTQAQTASVDKDSQTRKPIHYQRVGVLWGVVMDLGFAAYMFFAATGPHTSGWWELVGKYFFWAFVGLIFWLPGGWLFGFLMKVTLDKKGDQTLLLSFDSDGAIVPHSISPQIGDQEKEDNPSR
jgi:ABC-type dipeptide/oligopeptide/nickel transport system permease component